jgi:hypothetical protein
MKHDVFVYNFLNKFYWTGSFSKYYLPSMLLSQLTFLLSQAVRVI